MSGCQANDPASRGTLRSWLLPTRPSAPGRITDRAQQRAVIVELALVFTLTLGFSAAQSLLELLDALLDPQPLADQQVTLNAPSANVPAIDLAHQLLSALRLFAWAALGIYLLWRSGIGPRVIGLDRRHTGRDLAGGAGLAALIGIPGLGLYLAAHAVGLALTVQPTTLDDAWWRAPVLVLSAFANAFAEEALVVGYLLTRLRQLGRTENGALAISAVLRGAYHLYQGIGGFLGNIVMGIVYGRVWQRTNRLWPLVLGHALIDVVAFIGYALLRDTLTWLP